MTTSDAHKRKCWNCGNVAVHMKSIVPEVLCTKCGSQDTRRIKDELPKPSIKVTSVLGDSRIEVSDGVHSIALGLTRKGVEALIGELQTVLDMADDPEDDPNEPDDDSCPRCGGSGQVVTEQHESYHSAVCILCPQCNS